MKSKEIEKDIPCFQKKTEEAILTPSKRFKNNENHQG